MKCGHQLSDMEAACADGACPLCLQIRVNQLQGGAERYWEARWRDEKAENERFRRALEQVADGTIDEDFPFRAIGRDQMKLIARQAISAPVTETTHNSGEGDPSVMPDSIGADTALAPADGGGK